MRMSPIGKSGQFLFPQPFECNHKRHLLKSYDLSFYFQIDVTSFAKNCHEDTCNCNLGGDCECLCTSVAAYAYKCCQEGVPVRWRSPTVCGGYLAQDVMKWIVFKKIPNYLSLYCGAIPWNSWKHRFQLSTFHSLLSVTNYHISKRKKFAVFLYV